MADALKPGTLAYAAEYDRINTLFIAEQELSAEEHLWFRDAVLLSWEASKAKLESAKAAEMDIRKFFVKFAFDPTQIKGTERIELENGYQAKAVKKVNYNVDQELVNDALDKIEATGAEGKVIASRLIKWTADLSLTEYNLLDDKYKVLIDTCITTTEGAPTLEIVAPKGQKRK